MGNLIATLVSGLTKIVGDLIGPPLDFLSGKSCRFVCGPIWDLVCYIENFCIANLLKLLAVLVLLYIVLLFLYILYKIGICGCIGRGTCKMLHACMSSCFSMCEYSTMYLWYRIRNIRKIREERKFEMEEYMYSSSTTDEEDDIEAQYVGFRRTFSQKMRDDKRRLYMQKSLKPRAHKIRVGISKNSINVMHEREGRFTRRRHEGSMHNIRVTQTSRFVQKSHGRKMHHRRW